MSTPLVLRNRAFGTAWAGQFLAQAAARAFQVGVVWWLVSLSSSAAPGRQAGLLLMVSTLPAVVLVPLSTRLIAAFPRPRVLACAATGAGLIASGTAATTAQNPLPLITLCALALLLSSCQAIFDPALSTAIPELVEDKDIEAATGFQLSTQSVASLTGGFLGPLAVEALGLPGLCTTVALAYGFSAALMFSIPGRTPALIDAPRTPTSRPTVLRRLPQVRAVLLCFTAANFFSTAVFIIMPLYARGVLGASGATVSLFEAALGAGTITGAMVGGAIPGRLRTLGAAGLTFTGLAYCLPGLLPITPVVVAALFLAGLCIGAIGVRFVSFFQRTVPAADKPAFFVLMQALITATLPASSFFFGGLGDVVDVRVLCLIQGLGLLPVAALMWKVGGNRAAR